MSWNTLPDKQIATDFDPPWASIYDQIREVASVVHGVPVEEPESAAFLFGSVIALQRERVLRRRSAMVSSVFGRCTLELVRQAVGKGRFSVDPEGGKVRERLTGKTWR